MNLARLAEIEAALAETGISGIPLEWVRELCETVRAAWAERDAYKKAKQENDERFMNERDAARDQVRQLREALEGALLYVFKDRERTEKTRAVLEATQCP